MPISEWRRCSARPRVDQIQTQVGKVSQIPSSELSAMGQDSGGNHRIRRGHGPRQPFTGAQQIGVPMGRFTAEGPNPACKDFGHQFIPALLKALLAPPIGKPGDAMGSSSSTPPSEAKWAWIRWPRPGPSGLRAPQDRASRKIVRTSSSIERPWRAAWRRNCALVASSRLRTVSVAIRMHAMQATLAP